VRPGDEVKVFYDPMIAKLIAYGRDRSDALRRMRSALDQMQVCTCNQRERRWVGV
jgi:acetyl/propionyl-CoA carboxylase alpha subunit